MDRLWDRYVCSSRHSPRVRAVGQALGETDEATDQRRPAVAAAEVAGVVEQTFIRVKSFRRFDGSAAIARAFIARGRW